MCYIKELEKRLSGIKEYFVLDKKENALCPTEKAVNELVVFEDYNGLPMSTILGSRIYIYQDAVGEYIELLYPYRFTTSHIEEDFKTLNLGYGSFTIVHSGLLSLYRFKIYLDNDLNKYCKNL